MGDPLDTTDTARPQAQSPGRQFLLHDLGVLRRHAVAMGFEPPAQMPQETLLFVERQIAPDGLSLLAQRIENALPWQSRFICRGEGMPEPAAEACVRSSPDWW